MKCFEGRTRVFAVMLLSCPWDPAAFPQTATASIAGLATDPSGALVGAVSVTAHNLATNLAYTASTNGTGNYILPALPPGIYRVTAELAGFKRRVFDRVEVNVDQTVRLDVPMEIGEQKEEVAVIAEAPLINTENAAVGQVVGRKQITDLPLNGRNYIQLASLLPGVPPGNRGFAATGGLAGVSGLNFYAGGRNTHNSFLVDGFDTRSETNLHVAAIPNLDTIAEFNLQTSGYAAEFGAANAVVNVVTAGGGNQLHGTAFEFFRNDKLDARNFFDVRRPPFHRNQFGGVLSGPLRKDRGFFLAGYEGLRERLGATRLDSVPTARERAGDYTEHRGPVIDIFAQAPFPGNIIPAGRIHPVGRAIAALYPLPNLPGTLSNFLHNPIQPRTDHTVSLRLDHDFSSRNRAWLRYLLNSRKDSRSGLPGFRDSARDDAHNAVATWTHLFSPNLLNHARAGYQRSVTSFISDNEGRVGHLGGLGISGPTPPPDRDAYPIFVVAGKTVIGDFPGRQAFENVHSLADSVTWIRGRHSSKFGYQARFKQVNAFLNQIWLRGGFFFFPVFGGGPIGSGMPDLITGNPVQAQTIVGQTAGIRGDHRANDQSFFLQDDWRVTPRLTVNLGLRYDYFQPWVDKDDTIGTFTTGIGAKRGAFPNGLIVRANTPEAEAAGFTGRAKRALYFPDRNNWGPRGGLAWRPLGDNNTVVRASYGVFYSPMLFLTHSFLNLSPPIIGFEVVQGLLNVANAFPPFDGNYNRQSGWGLANDIVNGYVQQWNITFQRRVRSGVGVEAGYVANKGTHLDGSVALVNQALPGAGPMNLRRPHPAFGRYESRDSRVSSTYHSLQSKVEKRFAAGLFLLGGYTWSKAIDDGPASADVFAGGDVVNVQNSAAPDEKGLSLFDVRHRFVLSWIYELPFRSRGNRTLDQFLGGWQLNGVVSRQSGFPLSPRTGANNSGSDTGSLSFVDRPDRVKDGNLPKSQRTPQRWFDTTAFVPNRPGYFGNSGRGIVTADGVDNWDLALFKDFRFSERGKLQLRIETFNSFNQVNFGFPNLEVASAAFGLINSAGTSRQMQLGLKYQY